MHSTFDVSKWEQDSGDFTPGPKGQQTQNLPNTGVGSCPPGGETGAARGSRGSCVPQECPKTPEPEEPTEQFDTPGTSAPSSTTFITQKGLNP